MFQGTLESAPSGGGAQGQMILDGVLNLKNTCGRFRDLINDNREIFKRYFKTDLFPGSLNVRVDTPADLQQNLDKGVYPPAFIVPREELVGMLDYIGDGQAWPCRLSSTNFENPMDCWIFRRIGSRVPQGIIELVAIHELVKPFGLQDGDPVTLEAFG